MSYPRSLRVARAGIIVFVYAIGAAFASVALAYGVFVPDALTGRIDEPDHWPLIVVPFMLCVLFSLTAFMSGHALRGRAGVRAVVITKGLLILTGLTLAGGVTLVMAL